MTSNSRGRATSIASTAMIAALSLIGFACTPDEILDVQDPDIINPSNVESAAGAEAVRLGALSRFNGATSGDESLFLLGGLFSDEWINGDSFIARQEIDQRVITPENTFLLAANRQLHRVRLSAAQAVDLLRKYTPTGPGWKVGEMFMLEAYVIDLLAEHYCDGLVLSNVVEGREVYGEPMTTQAAFEMALGLVDEGLTAVSGSSADDVRVRSALALTKGRILANLNRQSDAAAAVAGVATSFQYVNMQSVSTWTNAWWSWNVNSRRYSVSDNEGTNGMDFASADDPRVPVCTGGDDVCKSIGVTRADRDDLTGPFNVLMLWPGREQAVPIMQGVDARMIEAEAQLKAGSATGALATLNAARETVGLTPLEDAGSDEARVSQLFRERAFWQYGRGYRTGDLRRLVRQYGRSESVVFPVGAWHKGGDYGTDVNMPVPQAEQNNPNVGVGAQTCLNRAA